LRSGVNPAASRPSFSASESALAAADGLLAVAQINLGLLQYSNASKVSCSGSPPNSPELRTAADTCSAILNKSCMRASATEPTKTSVTWKLTAGTRRPPSACKTLRAAPARAVCCSARGHKAKKTRRMDSEARTGSKGGMDRQVFVKPTDRIRVRRSRHRPRDAPVLTSPSDPGRSPLQRAGGAAQLQHNGSR